MQQIKQATNHRNYLRDFHQMLSGTRSLARAAFDRLQPGQKKLLMDASGIRPRSTMIYNGDSQFMHTWHTNYDDLTDSELDDLQKGLRRLQAIIDVFAICEPKDFIKEQKQKAA